MLISYQVSIHQVSGGHRRGVTPVPIPNTEVKPSTADGTACVSVWESRSLPGLNREARCESIGPFLLASVLQPSTSSLQPFSLQPSTFSAFSLGLRFLWPS